MTSLQDYPCLMALIVVDHSLSKGVILCPTKRSITADGIAAIIFQKLYACFGLFDAVILDQGPQLTANFPREFSCILRYISPYPWHITLQLMEKQKGSIRKLKPTPPASSVVHTLKHG